MRARWKTLLVASSSLAVVAAGACGDGAAPAGTDGMDASGRVTAELIVAPTDARCLVFTATPATGTPVVRQFPVTPGQLLVFDISNLPTGVVTLVEQAFTVACPVPASQSPTWVSPPITLTLTAGTPVAVTFNLQRVDAGGQITATTNFPPASNQLVEFLPSGIRFADSITAGLDGNLWAPVDTGIAKITTAGDAVVFPSATAVATFITNGPDGNLWFTDFIFGRIGFVTTTGVITEFALPSATSGPQGIVAGRDGTLYFTEFNANLLGRITTGGTITEFAIPTAGSGPGFVAATQDNNIWFTETLSGKVARFVPSTGAITEFALPTSGSGPSSIVSGPDGNLWFTERFAGRIGRITLAGSVVEFALPNPLATPDGISSGPDGNLWFAEPFVPAIARITPLGAITEFFVSAGSQPVDTTPGPDGNVWFTSIGGAPEIGHIQP